MSESVPALEIKSICVKIKNAQILNDVSLTVPHGGIFGLIGLNGAGKTTLIKTILDMRPADSGTVNIYGKPSTLSASRAALAFLPERFDPPWFLNGFEFIDFAAKFYGPPPPRETVTQWAQALALDAAALPRRMNTYSKGMRQKLGLIATLLTNTKLLILDEPMSGLDPMARALVKKALTRARDEGRTIFLSSHILNDMDEICSGIGIIHEGIIRYVGTPQSLKQEQGSASLENAFLQLIEKPRAA